MKTKFATIIAATALLFSTAVTKADNGAITLESTGHINKIEASGNVEVYITNGKEDGIQVYSDYYSENAMVQNVDGTLRIASYKNDALVVVVSVTDLRAITANDNAIIKSYNGLSALSLNINLNDKAIATLDVNAVAANITVNDEARADLKGMIENYHIDYSATAKVNKDELEAYSSSVREIVKPKNTRAPRNLRMTAAL